MTRRKSRQVWVSKADGREEAFSKTKLFNSLRYTGLPRTHCRNIVAEIEHGLPSGTSTKEIYGRAKRLVEKESRRASAHYSLKRALFDLGPAGHNFEAFVARYFEAKGFETRTCLTVPGRLVQHEIDVEAYKTGKMYYVECKFHNRAGLKNDIKVALYVKARWDDLRQATGGKRLSGFYFVTNTSFTSDAITYANGSGLKLLGVNMPEKKSFFQEIHELGLYPVTSLKRLTKLHKSLLLANDIILAKDILSSAKAPYLLNLSESEYQSLIDEVKLLQQGEKR